MHPARIQAALAGLAPSDRPLVTSATQLLLERRGPERVIGVTGTKGKSSTSALIAHALRQHTTCTLAGNCGVSPLDVRDSTDEWMVLELANFQTMDLASAPRHVVVRGVSADHLDWHGSVDEYVDAKRQLARAQDGRGVVVFDAADPVSASIAAASPGRPIAAPSDDVRAVDRMLCIRGARVAHLDPERHPGAHGVGNAIAAAAVLDAVGMAAEAIGMAIETFAGLPHRLEALSPAGKIRVVNDSHSTAVPSTLAALDAVPGPVVLLLGGQSKGADLDALAQGVARADVRRCLTFGQDGRRFARALRDEGVPVIELPADAPIDVLVDQALAAAVPGDCVLLSPAAASLDQHSSAAARGDAFRAAVSARAAGRTRCAGQPPCARTMSR